MSQPERENSREAIAPRPLTIGEISAQAVQFRDAMIEKGEWFQGCHAEETDSLLSDRICAALYDVEPSSLRRHGGLDYLRALRAAGLLIILAAPLGGCGALVAGAVGGGLVAAVAVHHHHHWRHYAP